MGIWGLLGLGAAIGIAIGYFLPSQKTGCIALLIIPLGMIAYISWSQGAHPESLRSTSPLNFVFGPLWPSIGAIIGWYVTFSVRQSHGGDDQE